MRLIHTSDWHLGRRLHGEDLLEHQATFLGWLRDLAVAEAVDAVLVSGDVYDRAQPGAEAIRLLDAAVARFARAGVALVVSSGNHDSAVRLQYGGQVFASAGIHLRTTVDQVVQPVLFTTDEGEVGVYGIPYVLPDAVTGELDVDRSHAAVLGTLAGRIRQDARARGLDAVVVMAHAFVTGASACDSEREIRVGGVGDVPADVFEGFSYVALGHLHGAQDVDLPGSSTMVSYSGSPMPFSFSERDHEKSVSLVEVRAGGTVSIRRIPTPVARPLRQVTGRLDDLVERARGDLRELADAWVKVILTDPGRVASPMERLRNDWPHTLVLEFRPDGDGSRVGDLVRLSENTDPVEICSTFVRAVSGDDPTPRQRELLVQAVATCQAQEMAG